MKSLNIILLEDSEFDADLIERELKKAGIDFSCRVVETRTEFEKALLEFPPDVVLSDHSMPQFNSIEAFQMVKAYQRKSNALIPFILITGEVSEEFAAQCLRAGVNDYILKDRLKRLPLAIQSALEKCRIETERLQYFDEVILKEALMTEAGHLAHLGSWQADLVTGKHTWSDETYCIFGYEAGEIAPGFDAFFALVHPEDVDMLQNTMDQALENLDPEVEVEFRLTDRKGNPKYISGKVQIHRNAGGRPVRLIGFNLDITERKKAEIRLQKSEQEYKSLFDQNPDAVFSLDVTGTLTNANKAVFDLTGASAGQLHTLQFRPFVHAEDQDRVDRHFLATLQGDAQRFSTKMISGAGHTLIFDVTYMPIVVEGKVIGVHGVAKDITRKRDLENMLGQAYRFARIGGWELRLPEEKISWTGITREIHEVDASFDPDMSAAIGFYKPGENRETIRQAVEQCRQSGTPFELELQIITARGNERWVRVTGEAAMERGKCTRLFGTFQDIDDRRRAEETVREAFQEKISILESIGDGFFAVDKTWTVTYWNNMAEKLLRMPRQNVLGKNLWDVYDDARKLAFYDQYHKAMEGNIPVQFEEFYPALRMWLEVNVYPSPLGLSIYFKNITDQKDRMREIQKQNEQLKEIARIQSHDVRAPLARMMGLVNLIQKGLGKDQEVPHLLHDITLCANELDTIIRRIVCAAEKMEHDSGR
ncbi:MAG: PAS domain S-box protein [Chryseosolibacter sp.]